MISQAVIEKQVTKLGPRAAGIHYRRSYRRAYEKSQRMLMYSPTDTAGRAHLQTVMNDALYAMHYIAKTYLTEESQ